MDERGGKMGRRRPALAVKRVEIRQLRREGGREGTVGRKGRKVGGESRVQWWW